MATKHPVKPIYTGGTLSGIGEFSAEDYVPIEDGGTGASTAEGAREELGVSYATIDAATKSWLYDDVSGAVNKVILTRSAGLGNVEALADGIVVAFTLANDITGAATLKLGSLPAKNFTAEGGGNVSAKAGDFIVAKLVNGVFVAVFISATTGCAQLPPENPIINAVVPIENVVAGRNNQGLTYIGGHFIIALDTGSQSRLIKVTQYGDLVAGWGDTDINIGHGAGLAYNPHTNTIYVANGGGGNATIIYEVDATDGTTIKKSTDVTQYGNSGLIGYDPGTRKIILHTGASNSSEKTFKIMDENYNVESSFTVPNQGTPQGLDYDGKVIYYYCDNKIVYLSPTGEILGQSNTHFDSENEGLTLMREGGYTSIAVADRKFIGIIRMGDSQQLQSIQQIGAPYVKSNTDLMHPVQLDFGLRIHNSGGTITATTEGFGNSRNFDNLFDITIDTSLNRIVMAPKKPIFDVVDSMSAERHPYHSEEKPIVDIDASSTISVYFEADGKKYHPTLPSTMANMGNNHSYIYFVHFGNKIEAIGYADIKGDINYGTTLFTLPSWLYPGMKTAININIETDGKRGKLRVSEDGKVNYYGNKLTNGMRMSLHGSYLPANRHLELSAIEDNWLGWISAKGSSKFNVMV